MSPFMGQISEPRKHHYSFAHEVLRQLVFQNGEQILPVLASPDANEFLLMLWDNVANTLPENEKVNCDGLVCMPFHKVNEDLAATVISMPKALKPAEVIHIIILFKISTSQCRYITLEKSRKFLMVCEWTSDEQHRNLSFGIKIAQQETLSRDDFLNLVVTELPPNEW